VVSVVKLFFKTHAAVTLTPQLSGLTKSPEAKAARKRSKFAATESSMSFYSDMPPKATSIIATGGDAPRIIQNQVRDCRVGKRVTIVHPANLYECFLGDDVFVGPFVEIQAGVRIGARTRVQSHALLCEFVVIGTDCFIGHGAKFVNDLMKGRKLSREFRADKMMKTCVGNNVVIGTNVTMLPVNVCNDVVIGAGAVVVRDITESGVYVGNPARRVGDFDASS
jgi:acetyltransferase-like isoleucine patch superfamily enzyme